MGDGNSFDFANWMGNLPENIVQLPLHQIAIPGSHNSFSYSIRKTTKITPDDPDLMFLNKIPFVNNLSKIIVQRWSVTQSNSCTNQLKNGIRYLDLRLAVNPDDGELNLIHGLYGITFKNAMAEIHEFSCGHPREVVLLDFQHFYEFTPEIHSSTISDMLNTFGDTVCPFTPNPDEVSLSWLWASGYRLLIFYRDPSYSKSPKLWPSSSIPNPWPNTVSVTRMVDFLDVNYSSGRQGDKFYVTQGVLTPDMSFVVKHLCSTLKNTVMNVANPAVSDWLWGKHIGPSGINILMFDFSCSYPQLIKQVIDLNYGKVFCEKLMFQPNMSLKNLSISD